DEFAFLTCLKHQLYGSKKARFKDWKIGDYLAIKVDKALAGLAQIAGEPYYSKERIWDHGLYPHRIAIKFVHVALPENRLPVLGEIREALISAWGTTKYGTNILNEAALPESESQKIVDAIQAGKNDLDEVLKDLETYLIQAKAHQKAFSENKIRQHPKKNEKEYSPSPKLPPPKEYSPSPKLPPPKEYILSPVLPSPEEYIPSPELPSPEAISLKEKALHAKAQSLLIKLVPCNIDLFV